MRTIILVIALSLLSACQTIPEDYDLRIEEAYRYLEYEPVTDRWNAMLAKVKKQHPELDTERLNLYSNMKRLNRSVALVFAKHMTAGEIDRLSTLKNPVFSKALLDDLNGAYRDELETALLMSSLTR